MLFFEAVNKRHSYRGPFTSEQISRGDLETIVSAGIKAPSGYNDQTTSFVIVDKPDLINGIADILNNELLKQAKAVIVVVMDPVGAGRDLNFSVEDYSAATENILLAITALGYASAWIDGVLRRNGIAKKIGDLLGVPNSREVRVILPLGKPAEEVAEHPKKPFEERAWFNRYNG